MSIQHPAPSLRFWQAAAVVLLPMAAPASWALAQDKANPVVAPASGASSPAKARPVPVRVAASPVVKPGWADLTAAQRQALAPLASTWGGMSEAQKRKWLAMSQNFPKLSAPEQAVLHSRMTEWVALSPQQRTQARLNFGETKQIPADDKKAKWEAYKALPAEEKRKLAEDAAPRTPATAAAVKPVPAKKLANVPKPGPDAKTPRIASGPQGEASAPALPH